MSTEESGAKAQEKEPEVEEPGQGRPWRSRANPFHTRVYQTITAHTRPGAGRRPLRGTSGRAAEPQVGSGDRLAVTAKAMPSS